MCFMLISYTVLPKQQTRSHYLSVCLTVAVMMIALGFTIPLAAQPDQCFDEITPNDMYSLLECAWSGALIIAGGLSAGTWIFVRALSMNLQIVWDIVPGRKFFYISQAFGWGVPAALFTTVMAATGVSFRFGNVCHVNHPNSMADFWGPLLGMAALSGILQVVTFGYCIHVYLKNLWSDQSVQSSTNVSSNGLPSYTNSVHTQTARVVWRRLKKVLWLQWRGLCIVTIIFVDVVFFSIVFVYLDRIQTSVQRNYTKAAPWLACLAAHPDNKDACLAEVGAWLVSESMAVAVLLLLSFAGIQVFIFLTRPSIFPAWATFIRDRISRQDRDFVSLDASRPEARITSSHGLIQYGRRQSTTFEMQKPEKLRAMGIGVDNMDMKTPFSPSETIISSPDGSYRSPLPRSPYVDSPSDNSPDRNISPSAYPSINTRGRIPSEYLGRITPDTISAPFPARHRQPASTTAGTDYFTHYRPEMEAQSPSTTPRPYSPSTATSRRASSSYDDTRRYMAPHHSFSAPKTPSRASSMHSVATFADERRTSTHPYARGGLGLNPPSEAGESREDLGIERRHWGEGGRI